MVKKGEFIMEFNGTRVPIDAAAAALNVTEAFIRVGMKKGKLPIGPSIKKDHSCESGQSKMNN